MHVFFPSGQENTTNFHVVVPHSPLAVGTYIYTYYVGAYNKLTKDFKYYFRGSEISRSAGSDSAQNNHPDFMVGFKGKAGSYQDSVTISVNASAPIPDGLNFIVIVSEWSLLEQGITEYSQVFTNPTFGGDELSPLSITIGGSTFMAVLPFECSGCSDSFEVSLDGLHMPYHHDLPNYYISLLDEGGSMISSN